jgi:excisionase family DNA binding protein
MNPYSLTVAEACRRYGIGRTTIYALIGAKHISARKLGARTLIIADSVERYLASLPDIHATGGTGS